MKHEPTTATERVRAIRPLLLGSILPRRNGNCVQTTAVPGTRPGRCVNGAPSLTTRMLVAIAQSQGVDGLHRPVESEPRRQRLSGPMTYVKKNRRTIAACRMPHAATIPQSEPHRDPDQAPVETARTQSTAG